MDKEKIASFHRDNIINAANELFQEFGLENTTMNMIAKLSNYSTATIYVYFKNKEEIYYCLIYRCMQELYATITNIAEGKGHFEDKYYAICWAIVDLQKKYPIYFEGMVSHINMDFENDETPEVCKQIYDLGNALNVELFKVIEIARDRDHINQDMDSMKLIFLLWGCILGVIRMSDQKKDYFMLNSVTRKELLDFSFSTILKSIKNKE